MNLHIESEDLAKLPKRKKAAVKAKAKPAADRHRPAEPVVGPDVHVGDWIGGAFEFEAWLEQRDSVELDDIKALVDARVAQLKASRLAALQAEAAALGAKVSMPGKGKGQAAPIKYRDEHGNTWAGRGMKPVWLREAIDNGANLEDYLV